MIRMKGVRAIELRLPGKNTVATPGNTLSGVPGVEAGVVVSTTRNRSLKGYKVDTVGTIRYLRP